MKRKILISLLVLVLVFICANIVSYVCTKKSVIEYVFQKEEKMDEVWELMEDVENQTAVIDDYTITMEKYLYDETNYKGYVLFSVRREGHDMRKEYGEDTPKGGHGAVFGGERFGRFRFDSETYLSGTSYTRCKFDKEKDVMYVYYEFGVNMAYGGYKGEILLYDRETEFDDMSYEAIAFKYQMESNVIGSVYEMTYKDMVNHLFISPFSMKIQGEINVENNIEEFTILFKDGKKMEVIKSSEAKEGKSYSSGYGTVEGYTYEIIFEEYINLEEIEEIVINGESLKKLSEEEREKVEKAYGKVIGDE